LVSAGYLFPGTGWFGLAATALLPGIVLSLYYFDATSGHIGLRVALAAGLAISIATHQFLARHSTLPAGWEGVNTNFGDLGGPFKDFSAAQWIQDRIAASRARVIIFPEFVVPLWTNATKDFWGKTILSCRTSGQIFAIGAGLPREITAPGGRVSEVDLVKSYDFAAAIEALQVKDRNSRPLERTTDDPRRTSPAAFDNTMLILGAESSTFYQRIPVPIGMWHPFTQKGVPLRLDAPGILKLVSCPG
jgi:hypothetical protein